MNSWTRLSLVLNALLVLLALAVLVIMLDVRQRVDASASATSASVASLAVQVQTLRTQVSVLQQSVGDVSYSAVGSVHERLDAIFVKLEDHPLALDLQDIERAIREVDSHLSDVAQDVTWICDALPNC